MLLNVSSSNSPPSSKIYPRPTRSSPWRNLPSPPDQTTPPTTLTHHRPTPLHQPRRFTMATSQITQSLSDSWGSLQRYYSPGLQPKRAPTAPLLLSAYLTHQTHP